MKNAVWVAVCFVTINACYALDRNSSSTVITTQDSVLQLAVRYYSDGDYKRVVALNGPADSLSPSSKLSYIQGMSYSALYDYPHAIEKYQKAISVDSANVNYRFQYGRLLIQAGFLEGAVNELTSCVALDSTYLPASFQLGLLYNMQKNNPQRELRIFTFLISQNPDDFLSLYYVGDVLRRMELPDSGIKYTERSIAINPHYYPSVATS